MELVVLVAVLFAGVGLLGAIVWFERPRGVFQTVRLTFGADTTAEVVEGLLGSVAGLPSGVTVWIDVVADKHGIRHYLHARPQAVIDTLRSQWRGMLPSLRMDELEDALPEGWRAGAVVRLQGSHPVLRSDAGAEAAAALLGSLQPLSHGERVRVCWMLSPTTRPVLPDASTQGESRRALRADHLRALRAKYAGSVLGGSAVVAVMAGHPRRAEHLCSRVVSVMRSRRGAYGNVTVRWRGSKRLARLFGRPVAVGGDRYSPAELVGLVGLPVGAPRVPGLVIGTAPVLMPSPRIPRTGRVLAVSTWPGITRPLAQPIGAGHTLIAGPTGVGKSSLICSLAVQDVQAGRGFLLIDGKGGDLATDVLARVGDRTDVIELDPGNGYAPPGLRLFGRDADPQLTADLVLGIFADLFADSWGIFSAKWLRAALLLLAHDPEATLADLPFVFAASPAYRRRLLGRSEDVLLHATFAAFEAMGAAERSYQLAAPLQRVDEIVGRKVIRGVLAQPDPKLDMHEVLRTGKVVVVSLSPSRIGSVAARMIGALTLFKFFEAVQARASIAPERRRPFHLYMDEPAVLDATPAPIDSLLEMARGNNVGVTLSPQALSQLSPDLRASVMTNASTVVAFAQNSAADARLLAANLPGVEAEELQNLGKFEAILRVGLGAGDVAPPVSGRTLPPPPPTSDPEAVRRASSARYGTDPAVVDAALRERHQTPESARQKPVGRLRRQP